MYGQPLTPKADTPVLVTYVQCQRGKRIPRRVPRSLSSWRGPCSSGDVLRHRPGHCAGTRCTAVSLSSGRCAGWTIVLVLVERSAADRSLSPATQPAAAAAATQRRHRVLSTGNNARDRRFPAVTWPAGDVSGGGVAADRRGAPGSGSGRVERGERLVRRADRSIAADGTVTTGGVTLVVELDFPAVITAYNHVQFAPEFEPRVSGSQTSWSPDPRCWTAGSGHSLVWCGGYNYDSTSIRRPFDGLSKVT